MTKFSIHPTSRLSICLIALIISLLLLGELIGFVPDKSQVALDARKHLSETLAVQFALSAGKNNFNDIEIILTALVERNPEILSSAIRKTDGSLLAVAGNHMAIWQGFADGRSSMSYIQVPILQDDQLWGTVELSFMPLVSHMIPLACI